MHVNPSSHNGDRSACVTLGISRSVFQVWKTTLREVQGTKQYINRHVRLAPRRTGSASATALQMHTHAPALPDRHPLRIPCTLTHRLRQTGIRCVFLPKTIPMRPATFNTRFRIRLLCFGGGGLKLVSG